MQANSPHSDAPHDELDWNAFRYVACEMSPNEQWAFEETLSDSQETREAVARAVELSQAVVLAASVGRIANPSSLMSSISSGDEPRTNPSDPTDSDLVTPAPLAGHWVRRLTWISLGAAACLGLVLLSNFDLGSKAPRVANVSPHETTELNEALLWSEIRDQVALSIAGMVSLEGEESLDDVALLSLPLDDDEEEVPSWMIAAAGGQPTLPNTTPVEEN